jgi:hypothetical protein
VALNHAKELDTEVEALRTITSKVDYDRHLKARAEAAEAAAAGLNCKE